MRAIAPPTDSRADPQTSTPLPLLPGEWHARLLGTVELSDGTTVLRDFGGRTMEALFACLALRPSQALAREALIERLWPGVGLEVGRNRLRNALAMLRRALDGAGAGGLLRATRDTVALDLPERHSDLAQLELALAEGRWPQARALQAELLPGLSAQWVVEERQRLATRLQATPEQASSVAMRSAEPRGLPLPHSRFFGRETELAQLRSWLGSERLVSVVGHGGCGKSRLALELARSWVARRSAAHVALADCDDVRQIPEQIMAAWQAPATQVVMQAAADGTMLEPVVAALSGQQTLLVLDNLEQFNPAELSRCVASLLERLPGLRILATSRRPLDLAGERVLWLQSLPLPATQVMDSPALQMLLDRVRAVRSDRDWEGEHLPALVQLCTLVDGTPLALELAAARLQYGLPEALCAALAQGPSVLQRPASEGAPLSRHASIDATLRWSLQLLPAASASVFTQLSVFRGGFDADAARAVCGMVAHEDVLDTLVAHSLLQHSFDPQGRARYTMLHLVREFARQAVPESLRAGLRQRHRDWALRLAEGTPRRAADCLNAEDANLREAIASALADERSGDAIALGAALAPHFERQGIAPVTLEQLTEAVTRSRGDEPALHDLMLVLAELLINGAGRPELAATWAEQALALSHDARSRSLALYMKARIAWARTLDASGLRADLEEALLLAREAGSADAEARALWILGPVLRRLDGDPVAAEDCYRRAAVLFEQSDNAIMANRMRYLCANCALQQGDSQRALALHELCAVRCRELGDRIGLMRQRNEQGVALLQLQRWQEAAEAFAETIELAWLHHHRYLLVFGLFNLPQAAVRLGRERDACRLLGFARQHWPRHVGPMSAAVTAEADQVLGQAALMIGAAARHHAEAGAALAWHEAVALARSLLD